MKTKRVPKPSAAKNFHDFAMFSVFVVRPGSVFTRQRRSRVSPLRKPTLRHFLPDWCSSRLLYTLSWDAQSNLAQHKKAEETVEAAEAEQWGMLAKRAFNQWAEENEE